MVQNATLDMLLESSARGYQAPLTDSNRPYLFADVRGFHIYAELDLSLRLTAAEDPQDAQLFLGILQEYTLIAEACATRVGARVLEVQGERIHLILPTEEPTKDSVAAVVRFSISFTATVYARIGKRAGKAFRGMRMAADHGRAILLKAGDNASGSVISLGPCANAPAKRLRQTKAGNLALRHEHHFLLTGERKSTTWVDFPVLEISEQTRPFSSSELSTQFDADTTNIMERLAPELPRVRYAYGDYLNQYLTESATGPVTVQGYFVRADLDGFSKQVQTAFEKGESAIRELVARFFRILSYPDEFRKRMTRTIKLPMAGDCANLVVIPASESYDDSREHYPVKASSEWHSLGRGRTSTGVNWGDELAGARWSVGIAGGGEDESSGVVLIATLKGRDRDFLVAAGWSVGRSLDAQESEGVKADDTVVPDEDYSALDTPHQKPFKRHGPTFWIAHDLTIQKAEHAGIGVLSGGTAPYVASVNRSVPSPRPYHGL
jgi:hypothetical protein